MMKQHISKLVSMTFYHIWWLKKVQFILGLRSLPVSCLLLFWTD